MTTEDWIGTGLVSAIAALGLYEKRSAVGRAASWGLHFVLFALIGAYRVTFGTLRFVAKHEPSVAVMFTLAGCILSTILRFSPSTLDPGCHLADMPLLTPVIILAVLGVVIDTLFLIFDRDIN